VAANIVPADTARMVSSFLAGNLEEAREIHERLLPLFAALFVESNPIPVKAAMDMMGMPAGRPRLPLTQLTEKNRDHLMRVLTGYGLAVEDER
jgi:4-hydroxy-tetrahydrodipicolinate synthase